jgi:hypothetical protein
MKKALMAAIALIGVALSGSAEAGWQDGMVSITNARPDGVRVMIDRTYRGTVMPADAEAFEITPGQHHILVTCAKGYTLTEKTVDIAPFEAEAITVQAQAAALSMVNSAGTILYIDVDGERLATLRPSEHSSVKIPAGTHKVKATYRQHDRSHTLSAQSIRFSPGQTESVRFSPASTGRVKVVNDFGQTAHVRIDGEIMGSIRAGKSKLVESPIGAVRVELLIDGHVVAVDRLSVRRYHDTIFHADEPRAPQGRVELSNHRSGTVKIYIDGRLAGSIPSWSERAFTLPLGSHMIKAVTASNKVIYSRLVEVDRYDEIDIELVAHGGGSSSSFSSSYGAPMSY